MRFVVRFLSLLVTVLLLVTGCSGDIKPSTGTIVFGITSNLRVGVDILRLHVVRKIDGAIESEEDFIYDGSTPLVLPMEERFENLSDGTDVEVVLDAYGSTTTPLLSRTSKTTALAGRSLLLRVDLAAACAGSSAPMCGAEQTCSGGICVAAYTSPVMLDPYTPGWAQGQGDVCKPGDGSPILTIGKGQADYLPSNDYDVAQIEAGPQGGHHIWVALRMKNLRQSGSITKLTGHIEELNLDISPFTVIFTFDPDEGGYCKLYGLRLQLDGTVSVDQVLGKTLLVKAEVTDKDGDVGTAERWVKLSDTIL